MSKQRVLAAQITYMVVFKKTNLKEAFKLKFKTVNSTELKSAIKALCYETIRHYWFLEDKWLQNLSKKPKDKLVQVVLTQALAEFEYMQKPAHVIVNEAANTCKKLKKLWACGLVNSTLRKVTEIKDIKASNEAALYSHPAWWIEKLKHDWKDNWRQILNANNKKPPLWVRSKFPLENQHQHKYINSAYKIKAQEITENNDFINGNMSVQDASAQLAAYILKPQKGEVILDMCAAPGGKTCHLLELNSQIELDAMEVFPNRAKKIHENLQRLKLKAKVIIADATKPIKNKTYDKILLDAPCSASGIVRRQVDIKFLRQSKDIEKVTLIQEKLLNNAALSLKANGLLLYATCSVFNQENSHQVKKFLQSHPNFNEIELKYPFATNCEHGIQVISGTEDMDGFYYCLLKRTSTNKSI